MEKSSFERNLRLYTGFKVLADPLFWGPVIISYIMSVGQMSLTEIYVMEAIVVLGAVFVEVYTSAWADLLGRRWSLLIGASLSLLSITIFSFASSPLPIWISNILIMFGFAIISGADEAYLADLLKAEGRSNDLTRINGRLLGWGFIIRAVCGIVAGYLYAVDPRLPMFLSIPGVLAALVFSFLLTEPKRSERASHREHFDLMKMSVLFVGNNRSLKWIIAYMSLIAVAGKLWFFTYNPYFELVLLPPEFYGWVFSLINVFSWLASHYAYVVEKRCKERSIVIAILLFFVFSIVGLGLFTVPMAVLIIVFSGIPRGFSKVFFQTFINRHLDSKNRATVLSIQSSVTSLISSASLLLFGLVLKYQELPMSLLVLGASIMIFGIFSLLSYKRSFG